MLEQFHQIIWSTETLQFFQKPISFFIHLTGCVLYLAFCSRKCIVFGCMIYLFEVVPNYSRDNAKVDFYLIGLYFPSNSALLDFFLIVFI